MPKLIDVESAIADLKKYIEACKFERFRIGRSVTALRFIVGWLAKRPVVEAEPVVHGCWIFDFSLDDSNFYRCSVCGRQEVLLAKESTAEYFPYCHCGAKMDQRLTKSQAVPGCSLHNSADFMEVSYEEV